MMNRVVPLKGVVHSLRGTPQREAAPLRVHFLSNACSEKESIEEFGISPLVQPICQECLEDGAFVPRKAGQGREAIDSQV